MKAKCNSCIKKDVCYKYEWALGCNHYVDNNLINKVKEIVFSNDFPENKEDDLILLFTHEKEGGTNAKTNTNG